ncbi:MAG: metal ABC transporter permease [Pseudomonadota bacterium]
MIRITAMLDDLIVRATLAGVGVSVAAAPLGCFLIWRRMAYFGDATAHAALLGVAMAIGFEISVLAGVITVALAVALLLAQMERVGFTSDTALGVIAHTGLAFGLVAISLIGGIRFDLSVFLFGDVLTVSKTDIAYIWTAAALIVGVLCFRWSALLTSIVSPELATAAGQSPQRQTLWLSVLLALVVGIAIKIVGALLITALLILPAAAARPISRTPEMMAVIAVGFGVLASFLGIGASVQWDTPTGPSIVAVAGIGVAVTTIFAQLKRLN